MNISAPEDEINKYFDILLDINPDYELPSMDDKFVGKGDSTR